ncbi:MAG: HD domain-containing phosphohydrolase [Thermodesulfobacteriota bacterium]
MDPEAFQRAISRMVTQFTAAVQNAAVYPEDHPVVLNAIGQFHHLIDELFVRKKEITLLLIGDGFMIDKRPLPLAGASETALLQIFRDNAIERVSWMKGLSLAELDAFIRHLSMATLPQMRPARSIRFGKLEIREGSHGDGDDDDSPSAENEAVHQLEPLSAEERLRSIFGDALEGKRINMADSDEIVRHFMENLRRESNPLRLLAETKSNDEYTFTHASNVGILTLYLAEHLGFKGADLHHMGVAAILHDTGKVNTPEAILAKPGSLTPDERQVMEAHALQGAVRLMEQANIPDLAALAAFEHHMKYDGSGYPRVRGGWAQHIASQIIAIADVYDALRTIRPYRQESLPHDRIAQIFRNGSGTEFNPDLVARFLGLIDG